MGTKNEINVKSIESDYFVCAELTGNVEYIKKYFEDFEKTNSGIVWGFCQLDDTTSRIFVKHKNNLSIPKLIDKLERYRDILSELVQKKEAEREMEKEKASFIGTIKALLYIIRLKIPKNEEDKKNCAEKIANYIYPKI